MNKTENQIFDLIVTHVVDITTNVNFEMIKHSSMLSPLGMDSIGRAELIARMKEDLSLNVDAEEFYKANNLGELAFLFVKKLKEK